ncbi:hypothetical protein LVD17_04880 [Fulvivirga ulvae]|uniref:hypothetical protein n=1 Tax=Fulvivirga ulvae TaxID=2904245 RepID=UPI001F306E29|nr:hypothetical protein [Fulvivirga ulvae]UII33160.1 hypothetical protein LVD17_04880 [Fulvivirga ulvae]
MTFKKNWMVLAIPILLCFKCSPQSYQATASLPEPEPGKNPRLVKLIILNEEVMGFNNTTVFIDMLNHKMWKGIEEKLRYVSDEQARTFIRGIVLMMQKEYEQAYRQLAKIPDSAFGCQVGMLKTDCLFELGNKTVNYQHNYQQTMDCTENIDIKEIINTRYRFTRYE